MAGQDRREFLKAVARSMTYTAPLVYSLTAPIELVGQGKASKHKPGGGGMGMEMGMGMAAPAGVTAPWDRPPPGQRP